MAEKLRYETATVESVAPETPPGGVFTVEEFEGPIKRSKFCAGELPQVGDVIRFGLGRDGFVQEIEVVTAASAAPARGYQRSVVGASATAKDIQIIRQSSLTRAIEFLSYFEKIAPTPKDEGVEFDEEVSTLFALAERIENWCLR